MNANRRIVLASRPAGAASADNFRLESVPVPEPRPGQVLVRHHYLSLDPYMRGRMNDAKSYAPPQPLGEVMVGGTAGEVIASRHPAFRAGERVVGMGGWQEFALVDEPEQALERVDTTHVPLSAYLGPVGMPGITAWYGLSMILRPKPGETLVVSAASGAVGSVVGQLAKWRGCRVVGFAGGPAKCDYAVRELGFDACIDYKAAHDARSLDAALAAAAPAGVDACFENVGGRCLDATLGRMNAFGRIALCGLIAGFEAGPVPITNPGPILRARLAVQGFIIFEHRELWPWAVSELASAVAAGRLRYRETIAEGLERAPAAFLGLLRGENFGKQLVRLA
ncbi:MAG: NADP-dependent oxidoreductase [Proteobacteria bacterium]|nr:NADP-dependent oxidoreductase [Pseudomonadota bacterium]